MAFTANEMGLSAGNAFANNFLVFTQDGDEPMVEGVWPSVTIETRKKRAHRKSRNGCAKGQGTVPQALPSMSSADAKGPASGLLQMTYHQCDEKSPCGHCIKRGETCTRPRVAAKKILSIPEAGTEDVHLDHGSPSPSAGPHPDAPVNMLHMELFYHFVQHTAPTLSYPQISWEAILPQAVQKEYLLNALLSVSASHLSTLHPSSPHYAQASLSHLSQATSAFRHRLAAAAAAAAATATIGPADADADTDALMATAVLVYYATWSAAPDPTSPFLLATGARQIFLSAWRHFAASLPTRTRSSSSSSGTGGGAFSRVNVFGDCRVVEQLCDARGGRWRRTARRLAALWDDPRYARDRSRSRSRNSKALAAKEEEEEVSPTPPPPPSVGAYTVWNTSSLRALDPAVSDVFLSSLSLPPSADGEDSDSDSASAGLLLQRGAFERVATRVAVLTELGAHLPQSEGQGSSSPLPSSGSFPWADVESYILSSPLLCFSESLPLMLAGDARALVLLLHQDAAVRAVLAPRATWWALRRAEAMERRVGEELRARGLEVGVHPEEGRGDVNLTNQSTWGPVQREGERELDLDQESLYYIYICIYSLYERI
ncbi:uncharacterized protein E0L32_005514 [Thyridium curvatum]|uniref:Zn(2)-C6 fungal-type domain-containing protein n=1 Tax=Thyridium curvatum TaxID=1093900 RepID=A0A507BBU7_9PEZI|nr:uncharacterized protein E0L32_005514 [Thyridium curvatum]TPX14318.1 hypothetical protein E0L32_005514 [Thyridium curvatum]